MDLQPSKHGVIQEQEDRLGGLPNDLLHSILHDLPLKDAARTSGISRRWATMWLNALATSPILDFTDRDFVHRLTTAQAVATVSRCLNLHTAPLDKLRVALDFPLDGANLFGRDVLGWVATAVSRGANEVEVDLTLARGVGALLDVYDEDMFLALPGDMLMARNSLARLSLDRFSLWAVLPGAPGLAGLRSFSLSNSNVTEQEVQAVLSSCPLLEFLSLRSCPLVFSVTIIGDKLRCLELVNCQNVSELRVTAPALESLAFHGDVVYFSDDEDDDDEEEGGHHVATVDLGTAPALRDAYLSHIGFGDEFHIMHHYAYSEFLSLLAHAPTLTLCSVGLLILGQDGNHPNLDIDMTNVQELQLLMASLEYVDVQSMSSFFLFHPLPHLDRLFINMIGELDGDVAVGMTVEVVNDREISIYDDDFVLGQLKLIKVMNFQGTRWELVMLASLLKRAPALEQLVLVTDFTVEEEQEDPGDEVQKIIQGQVLAMQKASPEMRVTVCRPSEDQSPNPAHTKLYH